VPVGFIAVENGLAGSTVRLRAAFLASVAYAAWCVLAWFLFGRSSCWFGIMGRLQPESTWSVQSNLTDETDWWAFYVLVKPRRNSTKTSAPFFYRASTTLIAIPTIWGVGGTIYSTNRIDLGLDSKELEICFQATHAFC